MRGEFVHTLLSNDCARRSGLFIWKLEVIAELVCSLYSGSRAYRLASWWPWLERGVFDEIQIGSSP